MLIFVLRICGAPSVNIAHMSLGSLTNHWEGITANFDSEGGSVSATDS